MFQFTHPSNSEEQIAQQVLEIRLEMGLTQEQFAAKLDVSFPTVNRWKNKQTKPSPLAIQKLQKLLSARKTTGANQNAPIEEQTHPYTGVFPIGTLPKDLQILITHLTHRGLYLD